MIHGLGVPIASRNQEVPCIRFNLTELAIHYSLEISEGQLLQLIKIFLILFQLVKYKRMV